MATIGGTNSATLSLQQSLMQSRATQARREAESAEALARQRRLEAERAAEQAQSTATAPADAPLKPKAPAPRLDADVYSSPRLASQSQVDPPTQEFLVRMYTAAADKFAAAGNPLKSNPNAAAAKNALGQTTGRILSISA
ncbi:hypothetical protein RQP54_14400 [Curvibacter sp. APW13]|uniref:hypothetical protein n=1 Tax=Curvibacter sp. APW13 TaxID=3077236 RepID=UPI0028DE525A|nr:hypothetical protein [Curvibacter sp. APW13]MDT8992060.1 hypothetical protein [Curvibacter sp. APW13]